MEIVRERLGFCLLKTGLEALEENQALLVRFLGFGKLPFFGFVLFRLSFFLDLQWPRYNCSKLEVALFWYFETDSTIIAPMLDRGEPRGPVNLLEPLVIQQRQELLRGQLPQTIYSEDPTVFIANFVASDPFRRAFVDFSNHILGPHTAEDEKDFNGELSGRIFAELARIYLSARVKRRDVIISPKRTKDFCDLVDPGHELMEHPVSGDSLNGVHVPDGLVVNSGRIRAICEYTVIAQRDFGDYALAKYDGLRQAKDAFPQYFADARLLFVLPGPRTGDPKDVLPNELRKGREIQVEKLNFDRELFGHYVNAFLILLGRFPSQV